MTASAAVRICGRCNGRFVGDDRRGTYYCVTCQPLVVRQRAAEIRVGGTVKLRGASVPRWIILSISEDGERLTVRRLGFPEAKPFEIRRSLIDLAY